jgi:hypothetical protein
MVFEREGPFELLELRLGRLIFSANPLKIKDRLNGLAIAL